MAVHLPYFPVRVSEYKRDNGFRFVRADYFKQLVRSYIVLICDVVYFGKETPALRRNVLFIFQDMSSCSFVGRYRGFGGKFCLLLQCNVPYFYQTHFLIKISIIFFTFIYM
jgi:hypothetical protein